MDVAADDTIWIDARDLHVIGKGWTDTKSFYDRLPARAEAMVAPLTWNMSRNCAGMYVQFTTDAPTLKLRWTVQGPLAMPHMPATGASGLDVYTRDPAGQWRYVQIMGLPDAPTKTAPCSPPAGQLCRLYLPLYNNLDSLEIGIPSGTTLSQPDPAKDPKPIVFYGTSITQGGCASRPGMAYPSILGRWLDMPVINLGFSGTGTMETGMAKLLAELDPSLYVIDCLANISAETVAERTEPLVKTLRAAHADTPILLADDSNNWNSETKARAVLHGIQRKLTAEGDKNVHFLCGDGLLGHDTEGTVDGRHPTDLGMMRMAEIFTKAIRPLLQGR